MTCDLCLPGPRDPYLEDFCKGLVQCQASRDKDSDPPCAWKIGDAVVVRWGQKWRGRLGSVFTDDSVQDMLRKTGGKFERVEVPKLPPSME